MSLVRPFAIAALLLVAATNTASAQSSQPEQEPVTSVGTVWQGKTGFGLAEVASLAAPILWFSTGEPLLAAGERAIPEAHPCDASANGAVVYYQVVRIALRGRDKVGLPPQNDPFFVDRVKSFTLRYHLYFRGHFGNVTEVHDLEAIDMDIAIDPLPDGSRRVRVTRVAGLMRGTEWNANELQVEPSTKLPITILIEEGTHAGGPDRNADGLFTPRHDINRRVRDAQGVRDVDAGTRLAGGFDATMFKQRQRGFRLLPPAVPRIGADGNPLETTVSAAGELGRYELRAAQNVPACVTPPPDGRRLRTLMRDQRFNPDDEPDQYGRKWVHDLLKPLSGTNPLITNVSFRRDRTAGGAVTFRGVDIGQGYLLPRFTFTRDADLGFEALFTPTATRFLNWYVSAGIGNDLDEWKFVAEGGLKVNVRVTGFLKTATLNSEFAGFRFGIRTAGFDKLSPIRFIVEIGIGGW